MLNVFLRESDFQQEPNKTQNLLSVCASKCGCGNCSSLPLENHFSSIKLEMAEIKESDSDVTDP
jgi:hypothetical protein